MIIQDKETTIKEQEQRIAQLQEMLREKELELQEKDKQLTQQNQVLKKSEQEKQWWKGQFQEAKVQLQDEQNTSLLKRISEGILKRLPEGIRNFFTRNKTTQLNEAREIKELDSEGFDKRVQCSVDSSVQSANKVRDTRTNKREQSSDGFDYDDK